jgi:hypothetical protein
MVKARKKQRRQRARVGDRPNVRAVFVKAYQERLKGKNPLTTSLEAVACRVKHETGIEISRSTVRNNLIAHNLYGPWEREAAK